MMNIFAELRNEITPFDEYLSYMFEQKQIPIMDKEDMDIPLDVLVAELFFPQRKK